jgi:hypothetical protein
LPTLSLNENTKWINEQLIADMRKGALEDPNHPITEDRTKLIVDPTRTQRDGRPTYQVWLENPITQRWDQVLGQDRQPLMWHPEWTISPEKVRRDAEQQQQIETLRRVRRGEALVPSPVAPILPGP